MVDIASNLKIICDKLVAASAKRAPEFQHFQPKLVAVSKFHPSEAVIKAYEAGHRHFGENYVNELSEKANNAEILEKCKEIKWHFIGHLQRGNVNRLLKVENLYLVETVDSEKIAAALDNAWPKFRKSDAKLKVMVQVNTSREEAKSGCEVENASSMVKYVLEKCSNLEFTGLMTIGEYGYDVSQGPNPDFLTLVECKKKVCEELGLNSKRVDLSMGMSTDFEHAIELGSSLVRVGTAIFGDRPKKSD
ncbi:pyridoxal phosphate homeostasis protein [Copidosoma floridanum]|uniref:pyridoxal phosphate homeostasis protein n=1 Tax=Copidosoma floridanum TaxID=29053 RepID=UPI0006C97B5B|nr:pyridoxal phosphate homeostasis protein [Copidosoma floridanum]